MADALEYPEDCAKLQGWLRDEGFTVPLEQCEQFWEWRSALWSAGWLILSEDERRRLLEYWGRFCSLPRAERDGPH